MTTKTLAVKTFSPLKTFVVVNNSIAVGLLVMTFFAVALVTLPPFPLRSFSRTASVVAEYPTQVIQRLSLPMLSATLVEDRQTLAQWETSLLEQERSLAKMTVEKAFAAKHFDLVVVVVQLRESIQLEQGSRLLAAEDQERQHAAALERLESARKRWTALQSDLSWLPEVSF